VHRFISKDNDTYMKTAIEAGLRAMRTGGTSSRALGSSTGDVVPG
jgi:hypothetical protein